VFSAYLKFLDMIATALRKAHNIESLRYDGTMNSRKRELARTAFHVAAPDIPMLVTASAGGIGLNHLNHYNTITTIPLQLLPLVSILFN
jgi:SNF2 family DNA or RNA helicase